MPKGSMPEPHNKIGTAAILAAAIVTIVSGTLEIIETLCRWLL